MYFFGCLNKQDITFPRVVKNWKGDFNWMGLHTFITFDTRVV